MLKRRRAHGPEETGDLFEDGSSPPSGATQVRGEIAIHKVTDAPTFCRRGEHTNTPLALIRKTCRCPAGHLSNHRARRSNVATSRQWASESETDGEARGEPLATHGWPARTAKQAVSTSSQMLWLFDVYCFRGVTGPIFRRRETDVHRVSAGERINQLALSWLLVQCARITKGGAFASEP